MAENPFAVVSPEELTAEQANQLFVEMHSDYPEITRQGNMIVTGARGCGKSMLIRCSLPDFLMVRKGLGFSELPYLSLNVSVKKTALNLSELQKLNDLHMPYLINEHFMALYVVMCSFLQLSKIKYDLAKYDKKVYEEFYEETYSRFYKLSGGHCDFAVDFSTPNKFFDSLYQNLVDLSCSFIPYILNLYNTSEPELSYNLPLLSFSRFIVPVFTKLRDLPCFPAGKPILIFIDDADNLSKIQTQILNSWIASRTQPTISIKVFSQIGLYKTFLTPTDNLVESPHDYQELDISSKYTTKSNVDSSDYYYSKIIYVLFRRLKLAGYFTDIEETDKEAVEKALEAFFPTYDKQDEGIRLEANRIRKGYETAGRGYRVDDDIRRYAIPNYIRKLAGPSKSKPSFRYAGLESIIHLSSGIIRYLLDCVAKMYDVTTKRSGNPDDCLTCIPTDIQNTVLREKADFYLFSELPKSNELNEYNIDSNILISDYPRSTTEKLANLINSMGKTFQEILLSGSDDDPFSGRSERKVFSIALSNPGSVNNELKDVFRLGVRLGFLHQSFIGNKDGNGRTYLYVLNRCFAPIFTLDPSGFQGYLFMTNDDLLNAIYSGKRLRAINKTTDKENDLYQLRIDDFWET